MATFLPTFNIGEHSDLLQAIDGEVDGISIVIGDDCRNSIEDYQSVQKDVNGAILKTKVKNKTTGQTYEEHGHLSDTFRYMVVDTFRDAFVSFANRRKRNLYARDGALQFFNAGVSYEYGERVCYVMPGMGDRFVMVRADRVGERWHVTDAILRDTVSTAEMESLILGTEAGTVVLECSDAYFQFARELRSKSSGAVKVMREVGDIDGRIAATSDYVREHVLLSSTLAADNEDYGRFLDSLLDYNRDSESKHASAALSGLAQWVVRKN